MDLLSDTAPVPPVPALGGGWALRRICGPSGADVHGFAASHGDGPQEVLVRVQRVWQHPLRAAYPMGAHDIAVWLDRPAPDLAAGLLRALTPALFAADPRCRRVVAAPDEDDPRTQRVLEDGGFRRIAEADLPGGPVVLFAAEPPDIAGLPTAFDDMPH
ncbi:GNAT family N-acetyltransferase [Streptomyces sp. NPDC057623]|uniref:GNAT family N-acetyltransferase n=1 Tax=Streptomyces sp. NPDC057623 TaxID=3346187 RepID=UPI0036B10006